MNPLQASWTRKEAHEKEILKKGESPYLGIRNAAREFEGEAIRFEVRAGPTAGFYKVRYSPGASLRWYLRCLRMLSASSKVAIYDVGLPGKGRLRLRYIPAPQSRILLLPPGMSPSTHLQRSSVDSRTVMSKMKIDR